MASITADQVKHVAKLAKLTLSPEEIKRYTAQLSEVLNYVEILNELDTDGVEPTYQVIDNTVNVFREDTPHKSLTSEEALATAANAHNGYFQADGVFAEEEKELSKLNFRPRKRIDDCNAVLTLANPQGDLGHKDLFMTKGVETTAGSRVLEGYIPQYDATVVELLSRAGYVTKYKLNQDAWGHGASGENSDFGPTKNAWDQTKVAGGSSSGSAVAVARGEVKLSTATDTCGSVRMPAAFNNICGIKPTYGAVSRYGVIAFASSLDCPGLLASSLEELRDAFEKISTPDVHDATSQSRERKKINKRARRLGIPLEFISEGMDNEVKKVFLTAVDKFKQAGFEVEEVFLPHAKYGIAVYYIIAPTETASNLSRYDGIRYGYPRSYFGPEAKRRIMLGTYASSAGYRGRYYEKAARVRTLIKEDLENAFKRVDAIIAPVSPVLPFNIGEKVNDPLKLYLMDVYNAPASLSGTPSLAIPCGFSKSGLPIGMQLMGPRWSEEMLFDLGKEFQKLTAWHKLRPKS